MKRFNISNFLPAYLGGKTSTVPVPQHQAETVKDLSTYIAPIQLQRIRQDVSSWREAIREAESVWYPYRAKMQTLFVDTVLNGHVEACMNRRRNITLLRKFAFVDKNGKENEEVTDRFRDKQWFHDFIHHTLDARFYGFSLIQMGDIVDSEISSTKIVRRDCISPDRLRVQAFPYSIAGIPFMEEPQSNWCVYVPTLSENGLSKCGYGLLYKVGIYEIYLRNLLGFNGDYIEIFGSPMRWAKTSKMQGDPERIALEDAMASMGSTNYLITNPDDEIQLIESGKGSTKSDPYSSLEQRLEKKISKILLGHADALDSTPGKLGAEDSVTEALEDIQAADGMFVTNIVHSYLLPKLTKIGIGIPEGLYLRFSNDKEQQEQRSAENKENKVVADTVNVLGTAGFEVDENWISERTGMPVKKKEVVLPEDPNPLDIQNRLKELYHHEH